MVIVAADHTPCPDPVLQSGVWQSAHVITLLSKAGRQYLLTCKASRYCIWALQSSHLVDLPLYLDLRERVFGQTTQFLWKCRPAAGKIDRTIYHLLNDIFAEFLLCVSQQVIRFLMQEGSKI